MDYFSKFLRPSSGGIAIHKPAPDLAQEFHKSWTVVKETLTNPDESQLRRGINSTVVPAKLQSMVDALVLESTRNEEGTTGACLEYLLKNDVLGTLVRLSETDLPAGIQAEVLRAVQNMVVLLDEQFLVHSAVHRAVLRLLRNCVGDDLQEQMKLDGRRRVVGAAAGEGRGRREPSEYEEDLVNLLCILCSRIRTYRELLMIFFHDKHWYRSEPLFSVEEEEEGTNEEEEEEEAEYLARHGSTSIKDGTSSPVPSHATLTNASSTTTTNEKKKPEYEFLLFNYLLRFVHREGQIGDFARAGLLFLMDVAMSPSEPIQHTLLDTAPSFSSTLESDSTSSGGGADPITDAALALAEYILDGDFSQVLGAGLGAVYSLLPTKLYFPSPTSPPPGEGAGGMVNIGIGGTGATDEEDERQRLEVERQQALAIGMEAATSPDVKARVDHFLKMMEFLEDVVKRNRSSDSQVDANSLVGNAIVQSILDGVRTIFLENVFYPTILECSDADGSAVAVMAYIEVMIRTLGQAKLGDVLVEFLMSEDNEQQQLGDSSGERHPQRKGTKDLSGPPPTDKERKLRRRKSSAMTLLEMEAPETTNRPSEYFTSMGRFTLKDMLLTNLRSTKQDAVAQALQLFQSLLETHPRMCVERMLLVTRDEKATSWPWPALVNNKGTQDIMKPDEEEEDDDDVFVYPGASGDLEKAMVDESLFDQPQTTYSTHEREMGLYLTLVSRVDPSHNGDPFSTGYEHYLKDALLAIQGQSTYQHTEVEEEPFKHRLNVHDPILKMLLDAFRRFFSNDPRTNVALTGVLATLAMHPERSLAGWLTFGISDEDRAAGGTQESSYVYDNSDGDDRSIDFPISDSLEKESIYLPATSIADETTKPIVHTIFQGLVGQLERYRQLVDDFDVYLGERRQGLLFSENLTDAMKITMDVGGDGAFSMPVTETRPTTPVERPPAKKQSSTTAASIVSFLTPKKNKAGKSLLSSEPSTPPRGTSDGSNKVFSSPFGSHYKKTGAINVESLVPPAPAIFGGSRGTSLDAGTSKWGMEEEDVFGSGFREKELDGEDDDPFIDKNDNAVKLEGDGWRTVTLSHLLDNVVILEESMKELVSIIHARRSLGIDSVRYL